MKQLMRYRIAFDGKCTYASTLSMGVAFFLQAIYYFVFADLPSCSTLEIALFLILPLSLEGAWFLLLRGFKVNAPGLLGMLAAALCLLQGVQNLFCGSVLQAVFFMVWFVLAAVVVIFVSGGFMPYRVMIVLVFLIPLCVQLVILDQQIFSTGKYWEGLLQIASAFVTASLLLFSGALVPGKQD